MAEQMTNTVIQMTDDQIEAFLAVPQTCVFCTIGPQGRIHAVPTLYTWDGERFMVMADRGSQKHRNVERVPRATLCIERHEPQGYVTVEGPVEIQPRITAEDRIALWERYYPGEGKARMDEYNKTRADMPHAGSYENVVAFSITPERWITADRV